MAERLQPLFFSLNSHKKPRVYLLVDIFFIYNSD